MQITSHCIGMLACSGKEISGGMLLSSLSRIDIKESGPSLLTIDFSHGTKIKIFGIIYAT